MANRLRDARSPYLQTAKESPIDWYPWGEEAFNTAKAEDKPILLDIGAVWCHWCHVMDEGTYEHPDVVRRLAEDFVCIKVDRDERPDVDVRYQRAIAAMSGQGGWPLTAFLRGDGRPFFGGTYFPPEDAHGRVGFPKVLEQVAQTYKADRSRVDGAAEHVAAALRAHQEKESKPGELDGNMMDAVTMMLASRYDTRFGGFGDAPKFPHTSAIGLAISRYIVSGDEQLATMARRTLTKMMQGGIHDHVAGGFHRYSVDAHWTVPHFEKMAYDNAELLRVYAAAAVAFDEATFAEPASGIVDWFHVNGGADGYPASEDADAGPGDDGDHFTWTLDEVRAAVSTHIDDDNDPVVDVLRVRYGIADVGDMHHDKSRNVLEIERDHDDIAKDLGIDVADVVRLEREGMAALRKARKTRDAPFVDRTRYTSWIGMCISAELEAAAWLGRNDWSEHAHAALDRLTKDAWSKDAAWSHLPRNGDGDNNVHGFLEDQVWAGLACVDAYRFLGDDAALEQAEATGRILIDQFQADDGPMFDTTHESRRTPDAEPLGVPNKPWLDQGTPGLNPVAARFFARLARATGNHEWLDVARSILVPFAGSAPDMGIFAATWYQALEEVVDDVPVVTVFGYGDEDATQGLLEAARGVARPGVMVHLAEPGQGNDQVPGVVKGVVDNEDLIKDGPVALVCRGQHCEVPVRDVALLGRLIMRSPGASGESSD